MVIYGMWAANSKDLAAFSFAMSHASAKVAPEYSWEVVFGHD